MLLSSPLLGIEDPSRLPSFPLPLHSLSFARVKSTKRQLLSVLQACTLYFTRSPAEWRNLLYPIYHCQPGRSAYVNIVVYASRSDFAVIQFREDPGGDHSARSPRL